MQGNLLVRACGTINLNSLAYNLLEKPEAVLLLFDAKNRRMAVKLSNRGDSRAYPLNKHRKNNASIPATKFLEHYGYSPARRSATMPILTATCR